MRSCIAILLAVMACSCSSKYRAVTTANLSQKTYNLSYGSDKQQKMDVFIPHEVNADKPFVVLIHGGAWTLGNKRNIRMVQRFLMRNGIPSANLNYRLTSDQSHLDEQLEDIRLALESLDRNLDSHSLKPKKYILLGESSGGHISLLYGYQHPQQISSIIALFPPTDFTVDNQSNLVKEISVPIMQKLLGTTDVDAAKSALREASPIFKVSDVPTLLLQGTWDFVVDKNQSIALDSVLEQKKIKHRLVLVEKGTHFMRLNSNTRRTIIYPEILRWITQTN
ncbi:MAG: alpha/beta hydrolase [Flavobacterium sp.]|nr:MAG: alpha/beta hydrolase [Flavobacterium sp.]